MGIQPVLSNVKYVIFTLDFKLAPCSIFIGGVIRNKYICTTTTTTTATSKSLTEKRLSFLHYLSFRLLVSYTLILRPFLPSFQANNDAWNVGYSLLKT
jgi:hypothetical protein